MGLRRNALPEAKIMIPARRQARLKSSERNHHWFSCARGVESSAAPGEKPLTAEDAKKGRRERRDEQNQKIWSAFFAAFLCVLCGQRLFSRRSGRLDTIVGILTLVLPEKLGVPHALRDGISLHTCRSPCGRRELGSESKIPTTGCNSCNPWFVCAAGARSRRDRSR